MNGFNVISSILRSSWLLDESWIDANWSLIQMLLNGESVSFKSSAPSNLILDPSLARYNYRDGWTKAGKDSIALYDLRGPIMHYGFCGDGTHELHSAFNEAENASNITSHFLLIDSPGGQADGVLEFMQAIMASVKPSLSYINGGMAASGGGFIAAAADAVFASSKLCEIGSFGGYSTLLDATEREQREGVKRIVIKAKQSKDKNTVYELAKAGDKNALAELEDRISLVTGELLDAVRLGRGDRLKNDSWATGKMYFADEALTMGLIDGIGTMDDAIRHLRTLTSSKKTKNFNMNNFNNVAALASVEAEGAEAALDLANADLTAAGITDFTIVEQSVIDEGARVTAELATANASLATANTTIANQEATIQANQTRIQTLEGVIAKRAASDPGTKSKSAKKSTEDPEIEEEEPTTVAAHNQIADRGIFG
ncbi:MULTISPECIES: S49 family peptidase [Sphingobacterium]|uniref:S49 family peptidase n=1 Tax=Sphingobacterium TaxID=28453 RepID=UPI00257DE5A4|nr:MULTISPECIES: S49 family peptidase [Sphingobacterium]